MQNRIAMKILSRITLIIALLALSVRTTAQEGSNDIFTPIAQYISQGDIEKLSSLFAENLEISIISNSSNSSKNKAKQILKSFFNLHTPRSFDITHTTVKSNRTYALGRLNAGGEIFLVTIFVSFGNSSYKIQQFKVDKLN